MRRAKLRKTARGVVREWRWTLTGAVPGTAIAAACADLARWALGRNDLEAGLIYAVTGAAVFVIVPVMFSMMGSREP